MNSIFAAAILPATQAALERITATHGAHPPIYETPPFQKCPVELNLSDHVGCATILFSPDNTMTRTVMDEVGRLNEKFKGPRLRVQKDVLKGDSPPIPDFTHYELQPMTSKGDLKEYFRRFPKSFAVGVHFERLNATNGAYLYKIYSRGQSEVTNTFAQLGLTTPDNREVRLMQLIDSALIMKEAEGKKEKYVVRYSMKATPKDIGEIVQFMLGMFFSLFYPFAATQFMFSVLGTTLGRLWQEKRDRMSHYLKSVGMKTFPWLCVYLFLESIQYLLAGGIFYGASIAMKSAQFTKIDPLFFFVAIFVHSQVLTMFIIWVNTLVPSMQLASQYSVINNLIMMGIVVKSNRGMPQTTNPNLQEALKEGALSHLASGKDYLNFQAPWITRAALFIFPVSSITKFWMMLFTQSMASDHVTWSDMRELPVDTNDNMFDPPEGMSSITWNFVLLAINFVVLAVLNWYLKNVLPWSAGQSKPLYFLFTSSYWFGSKPFKPPASFFTKKLKGLDMEDPDIARVVERTKKCASDNFSLLFLTKTYYRGGLSDRSLLVSLFGMKGHLALQDFTLPLVKGQLMALLGHNGAGKSTLMSMITGAITPDSGGAVILEGSVAQADYLNKRMGVCAQADLLFGYLTVRQHINLVMGLRNVSASRHWPEMMRRLEAFRMTGAIDRRADQLSGGMKRRLSLLLATIGDPLVLLMDEPTAGMDPVNRRFVWRFLEGFTKNRYTLLTTHSMEEAENLAETIAVVRKGRLVAVGSTGHLRNRFALGYRLNLTVRYGGEDQLDKHVVGKVPGVTPEVRHTGMLRYLVPEESIGSMVAWLKEVEKNANSPATPIQKPRHVGIRSDDASETESVKSEGSKKTEVSSPALSAMSAESEAVPLSPVMPEEEKNPDVYVADWLFTQMTLEDVFHKLNSQVYQAQEAASTATASKTAKTNK